MSSGVHLPLVLVTGTTQKSVDGFGVREGARGGVIQRLGGIQILSNKDKVLKKCGE